MLQCQKQEKGELFRLCYYQLVLLIVASVGSTCNSKYVGMFPVSCKEKGPQTLWSLHSCH